MRVGGVACAHTGWQHAVRHLREGRERPPARRREARRPVLEPDHLRLEREHDVVDHGARAAGFRALQFRCVIELSFGV